MRLPTGRSGVGGAVPLCACSAAAVWRRHSHLLLPRHRRSVPPTLLRQPNPAQHRGVRACGHRARALDRWHRAVAGPRAPDRHDVHPAVRHADRYSVRQPVHAPHTARRPRATGSHGRAQRGRRGRRDMDDRQSLLGPAVVARGGAVLVQRDRGQVRASYACVHTCVLALWPRHGKPRSLVLIRGKLSKAYVPGLALM